MSHIIAFKVLGLAGQDKEIGYKLNRDINIFYGLNGSGKTSLLKIFHSAMTNNAEILTRVPFTAAEVKIYSINLDKVFTRSIEKPIKKRKRGKEVEIDHIGPHYIPPGHNIVDEVGGRYFYYISEEKEFRWKTLPQTPKNAQETKWHHQYLPTTRLHVGVESPYHRRPSKITESGVWVTEDELDSVFARAVDDLWAQYSSRILREVREAQEQGLTSILKEVLSKTKTYSKGRKMKLPEEKAYQRVRKFLSRQRSEQILGSFKTFEKLYKEDEKLQKIVRDIDTVEEKIESAMASRNRLEELIHKMVSGNKKILFTDNSIIVESNRGENIGLMSLSSGEKHLVRILVETLLATDSTIIIDEPEISLHVDWQRELISIMSFLNPNSQTIVATHSPEIFACVPDENIFSL